jgi:hypothetical protein
MTAVLDLVIGNGFGRDIPTAAALATAVALVLGRTGVGGS